jgi:hypothetical protein
MTKTNDQKLKDFQYAQLVLEASRRWSVRPDYLDIKKTTGMDKPEVFRTLQQYG